VSDTYQNNFEKAIIVTSDGDYAGLVRFIKERDKVLVVLSPSTEKKCSILLKRTGVKISYINDQRSILEAQNEKAPNADETASGSFS